MLKWILAALAIPILSLAISVGSMRLMEPAPHRFDPKASERAWQIDQQYEDLSLVTVLANPQRYDGHKVRVSGFATLTFEDYSLHLDRAAYEAGLPKNALWVTPPRWLDAQQARKLNRRYASVAGTFDASEHGHGGLYSGALTDVQQIRRTFTQADYQRWLQRNSRYVLAESFLSGWFLTLVGWFGLWAYWALAGRRR
jgi:hypothetical protein